MDDLGDIKIFRKNLMIISLINILIIIFSGNITDINILGIIKLNNVNTFNILILLLITNIYVLIRYKQYLFKKELNINNKILIFDIINNNYFKNNIIKINEMQSSNEKNYDNMYTTTKIYKKENIINIKFENGISIDYDFNDNDRDSIGTSYYMFGGITDKKIDGWINLDKKNKILSTILINNSENKLNDNISIYFKNNELILYLLKLKFYIKEHYFFDYYLPIILGIISIQLLIIKITYLIFK